jgi:uncharacterized protein with ATP-grasp and redox domains
VRIQWECLPCLLDDFLTAGRLVLSPEQQSAVFSRGLDILATGFDRERTPSYLITALHRLIKEAAGNSCPFAEQRRQCNRVVTALADGLRDSWSCLSPRERFGKALLWSVCANSLDFRTVGAGYTFAPHEIAAALSSVAARGLDVDDSAELWAKLQTQKSVLFIPDNVGEIALDRLLMEEIKATGAHLTVPVPTGAITSDVTLDDLRQVGVDVLADSIIYSGPDTLGISLEEMSDDLRDALHDSPLILAKGQANFYALTEISGSLPGTIACLLTTKCDLASAPFNGKGKLSAAKILRD